MAVAVAPLETSCAAFDYVVVVVVGCVAFVAFLALLSSSTQYPRLKINLEFRTFPVFI